PSGRDVLRRLGSESSEPVLPTSSPPSSGPRASLIGRDRHLAALADAFAAMKRGRTVSLYVHGRSGAGKSVLVQRFLDRLSREDEAVILAGRCYERESVPYKALDGLVDSLGRYLRSMPSAEARALLPRDVPLLAQVFPALRHAEAVAAAPRRVLNILDPHE